MSLHHPEDVWRGEEGGKVQVGLRTVADHMDFCLNVLQRLVSKDASALRGAFPLQ